MGENDRSASYPSDIGDLDVMSTHSDSDSDGDGTSSGDSLPAFDVDVSSGFARPRAGAEYNIDVLEGSGAEVAEDGTIVSDTITVTLDEESGMVVIDEVIGVLTPDGTQITDERISVLDEDDSLTLIAEDVEVSMADEA